VAGRLLSLDVFRGLTVAAMILVNNPGTWRAVYPPLRHAEWHGWTPTDLVFPFFLFIVGVAIPLALGRRATSSLAGKVIRRTLVIFALGLFLNAVPDFDLATIRIPGVLQRIALCYLAGAGLFLATGWRTQAAATAGVLLGYWAVMTLVPVPGFGAGDLGRAGNLAAYLDRHLLGPHLWRVARVYDPEGVLSTLPAIGTTLLGVLAGHWLRARPTATGTAIGLGMAGIAGVALGLAWGRWFPLNKALWTSSYAVFTAGAALLVLTACYGLVELGGCRRLVAPLAALGVNALALFFASTLLAKLLLLVEVTGADSRALSLQAWLFERGFAPWAAPVNASLAYALANVALWLVVAWLLSRWRIRLTV
jgi:predicted acyltransferase